MSKSAALGSLLRRLGLCSLALQARRRGWLGTDTLTILGYHRIAPAPTDGFHGEDDNISCEAAHFEREVVLLRRSFSPLTFAELLARREAGEPLPPNPLIVTFDVGYRDNAAVAAPVLSRHGMAACFFLTTGFLDGEALPWWDAVNRAFRRAPGDRIRLDSLEDAEFLLDGPGARARAARAVRGRFRFLPAARYPEVLAELAARAGCDLAPAAFREDFMTWDQARALAAEGFEIGAHTRTHPVLTRLETSAELDTELAGSRARLQAELGQPVIALAYPVGGPSAVDGRVVEAARRAGFAFACTYQDGVNHLRRLDCFLLRRIAVGSGATLSDFHAKLAFPWLFRRGNA